MHDKINHIELFTKALKPLSEIGWYISEDLTLNYIFLANNFLQKNKKILVDELMKKHFKKNLNTTKKNLIHYYPERSLILSEAFEAHRKKLFFASTSLFLIQSDGICKEQLYKKSKGKKIELKKIIELNQTPEHLKILLSLITEINSIDKKFYKEEMQGLILNRHGVMHGSDTTFGTELNSLKALSLLSFIGGFFERHKRIKYSS